ncbi:MAG TPA: hypothetical protein VF002_04255 [Gaiellaceae bacterium]
MSEFAPNSAEARAICSDCGLGGARRRNRVDRHSFRLEHRTLCQMCSLAGAWSYPELPREE